MFEFAISQIPGITLGFGSGCIGTFFYIQRKLKKDPAWVEDLYQKQRAISMQGTEEIDRLKSKIRELELSKEVAELKDKLSKLGG